MDKFLVKKRSAEDSVQPPPTKKSKPATKFNSSHSQEFSFMKYPKKEIRTRFAQSVYVILVSQVVEEMQSKDM